MTNPFLDQSRFMRACNQTVGAWNETQFNLYTSLIQEEVDELWTCEPILPRSILLPVA